MTPGNVAKIDHLLSPARDFPGPSGPPAFRYLLCSTPRCGSNLLGDLLQQSGQAGDPLEYLNPRFMAGYQRRFSQGQAAEPLRLFEYLQGIEQIRTSPNGHFGIKVHFEHLQAIFRQDVAKAVPWLKTFDRVLLLRRRDRVAQAVSLHKARVTQIWTSLDLQFLPADDPRRLRQAGFDPVAIGRALSDLLAQEFGWERLLRQADIHFAEVWYEDFVADQANQFRRVLGSLNLDQVTVPTAPRVARQGIEEDPMVRAFAEILGRGPQ